MMPDMLSAGHSRGHRRARPGVALWSPSRARSCVGRAPSPVHETVSPPLPSCAAPLARPTTPSHGENDEKDHDANGAHDVRDPGKCAGHVVGVRPHEAHSRPDSEQSDHSHERVERPSRGHDLHILPPSHGRRARTAPVDAQSGFCEHTFVYLAGVPVRDELVLELARLVNDDALAGRLETAYGRMTKVLALTIPERETIIRALDEAPAGLEELRAVLLREHVGRVRDGLA
jgi:hypothetical protein